MIKREEGGGQPVDRPREFEEGERTSVLELLPLAVVSGGQVQIRWAGLAWH